MGKYFDNKNLPKIEKDLLSLSTAVQSLYDLFNLANK